MRLLIAFDDQNLADRFSRYLENIKIDNSLDSSQDNQKTKFNIWIHNEDAIDLADNYLQEFLNDPMNSKYDVKREEPKSENIGNERPTKGIVGSKPAIITLFFLFICLSLYSVNYLQELAIKKKYNLKKIVLLTPIQKNLLYDLPTKRLLLDEVIIKYDLNTYKKLDNPPAEAQEDIQKIEATPAFNGLYDIILEKLQKPNKEIVIGPLFGKISKGEVWRLFTPALLHGGLLHILFNMLWLWYLGKLMEDKLKFFRFILFIIIVAVVSNTFQYLMGGPYFLGFSGVVTGMVGYIFVRQKVAPWEGYAIPNIVFYFIGIYIVAIMFIQIIAFVFQIFNPQSMFSPGIANTAHLVGALSGILLAKVPFFSRRSA